MPAQSRAEKAAALAAAQHHVKKPLLIDSAQAIDPRTHRTVYRYKIASAHDANGPALTVVLDEDGKSPELTVDLHVGLDNLISAASAASFKSGSYTRFGYSSSCDDSRFSEGELDWVEKKRWRELARAVRLPSAPASLRPQRLANPSHNCGSVPAELSELDPR
jgi:hypothetical protein